MKNIFLLSIIMIFLNNFIIYAFNKITNQKYINFRELSHKNTECLYYYRVYIKNTQKEYRLYKGGEYKEINFSEYLEYWWDLEESENALLERVCKYIYNFYQKNNSIK
jgi:hypothetical protein